jgi:hypothetical protein
MMDAEFMINLFIAGATAGTGFYLTVLFLDWLRQKFMARQVNEETTQPD